VGVNRRRDVDGALSMTLTEHCKELGLTSSKPLIEATGYTRQNLEHMMRNNYKVFRLLCLGVLSDLSRTDT
jgi:hypothetical protein